MVDGKLDRFVKCIDRILVVAEYKGAVDHDASILHDLDGLFVPAKAMIPLLIHLLEVVDVERLEPYHGAEAATAAHKVHKLRVFGYIERDLASPLDVERDECIEELFCLRDPRTSTLTHARV